MGRQDGSDSLQVVNGAGHCEPGELEHVALGLARGRITRWSHAATSREALEDSQLAVLGHVEDLPAELGVVTDHQGVTDLDESAFLDRFSR